MLQTQANLLKHLLKVPGGNSGLQVSGMIEWGQKSKPKKIPRASNNSPKKSVDQKLTPQKIPRQISKP